MSSTPPPPRPIADGSARGALSPELVIAGAVALADDVGMEGFTIRKLADAIGTRPMTIYHHVPNKEAIVDGMVDAVFAEIALPPTDTDWRSALTTRCRSMRAVLARHPWAAPLMETRTNPGPATLRHHDAVLGCLRSAGFSLELTAHAYALLDAYLYGAALQESTLPATAGAEMHELASAIAARMPPEQYPHLTELTFQHVLRPGYDFGAEFDFGLRLVLDGLQAAAAAEAETET